MTLRVAKDGLVDLRITGEPDSIINTTIPDTFPIEFVSFSSWGTAESKWFFDCEGDEDTHLSRSETTMRRYLPTQALLKDLLSNYDANVIPFKLNKITWKFNLVNAVFVSRKSQAKIRGYFTAVRFSL